MTNEEVIRKVKIAFEWWEDNARMEEDEDWSRQHEARDMAIKALEQKDVLDKIRAEIEAEMNNYSSMWVGHKFIGHTDQCIENILHNVLCQAKEQVLDIIDKYRAESDKEKDVNCTDLCKSCYTKGCIFQSGIVRNHCDFYKAESEE